ncbi:MAG: hypothetical protein HZB39_04215 [Planctomycetes bacterium]|nr:hypothetical protein [Planctomycetota bacterium]
MEAWRIHRERGRCPEPACPLPTADEFFAVLELPSCERHDLCATCFHRRVSQTGESPIFWKARRQEPGHRAPTIDLASLRVLFDRLGEHDSDEARGLRYFVALLLLRKRVLRMVPAANQTEESADLVVLDPKVPGSARIALVAPELAGDRMAKLKDELLAALAEQEGASHDG